MTRLPVALSERRRPDAENLRRWTRAIGRAIFGDRYAFALFLGSLLLFSIYWRVGVFVTDSYAIANALVNVADGHLAVTRIEYSLTLGSQPGLWVSNGAVYGRNYAHVFLSLPVLWLLDGLAFLFDPRLVVTAGWSLLLLAFLAQFGQLVGRERRLKSVGAVLALLSFVGNVSIATPLSDTWLAFIALQVTTMLAAAFVGVVLYRLLSHIHDRRVGLLVGTATVVATPVGFWASVPKRHALSTFAVLATLGAFYFARATDSDRTALGVRALSYVVLALFAWLHALEALVVFAALVPLDLVTARSNHPRRLAVVAVVFLVALTPFFFTNLVIAGNPLQPPRSLDAFSGQVDPLSDGATGAGGGGGGTPTPTPTPEQTTTTNATNTSTTNATNGTGAAGGDGAGPPTPTDGADSGQSPFAWVAPLLAAITGVGAAVLDGSLWALGMGWSYVDTGLTIVTDEPGRLYHTFVRSGRIPTDVRYRINQQEAIDLAFLEVVPLLGGLAGILAAGLRRAVGGVTPTAVVASFTRPARQTDVLAVAVGVLFVLMNLERLPVHAQLTVRYLVPIVPLGMYALGRLAPVHRVAQVDWRWILGPYLTVCLVGGAGLFAAHLWLALAVGEAMQLHALLGLASAAVLAVWAVVEGAGLRPDARVGACVVALPAGLTTLFVLFTGLVYFQYGEYALPVAGAIANWLPITV